MAASAPSLMKCEAAAAEYSDSSTGETGTPASASFLTPRGAYSRILSKGSLADSAVFSRTSSYQDRQENYVISGLSAFASPPPHAAAADGVGVGAHAAAATTRLLAKASAPAPPAAKLSARPPATPAARTLGEWRRRKYHASGGESTILIEGFMQQQGFLGFWRWRWCVLDQEELRLYRSERAAEREPGRPLQRLATAAFQVCIYDSRPTTLLLCSDALDEKPLMYLRAGLGKRWEEIAAARLWVRCLAPYSAR